MNVFEFEEEYLKLLNIQSKENSPRILLLEYADFIFTLLKVSSETLKEAYFSELIQIIVFPLKVYTPIGIKPSETEKILSAVREALKYCQKEELIHQIKQSLERISNELFELKNILDGEESNEGIDKLCFPVIEKNILSKYKFGLIEELSIILNKNKSLTEIDFIVSPSLPLIEKRLKEQLHSSWSYAKNFIKKYTNKEIPNFELVIKFNHKYGIYEGNSLGVALTVGFIEVLVKYFDLKQIIRISGNILTTGSVNKNGIINSVSRKIIEVKAKTAFYSKINTFVVPEEDKKNALNIVEGEKKYYPKRKLTIIGVERISDILNRRDLIEFKKQNPLLWGTRRLLKNKVAVVLLATLLLFLGWTYLKNIDNNPHHIDYTSNAYVVKNKFNNFLWEKKSANNLTDYASALLRNDYKIIDYNDDGLNEVLFIDPTNSELILFSNLGKIIWKYKFNYQNLSTKEEIFTNSFSSSKILGITNIDDKKTIIAYSQHKPYYPTAIIKIDLTTGKRVGNILWHSGGIRDGELKDIDNDGNVELIASGINNGLKSAVLFSIQLNKLSGQSPSSPNYTFSNIPVADFEKYILLPKPDYFEYFFSKYFSSFGCKIKEKQKYISVKLIKHGAIKPRENIEVRFNFKFEPINIVLIDAYNEERDKLVKKGILEYPLSDTDEYKQILLSQIKFWNGKEFNKFENR